MQQSGQIIAHMAQPKQSALFLNFTGLTPFLLNLLSAAKDPLGQKLMHRRQPLHFFLSMTILGIYLNII
jgi:hypothetical protein